MSSQPDWTIRQAALEKAPLLAGLVRRPFQDVAAEFGLRPDTFRWHPSNYQDQWVRDDMVHGITFFIVEVRGLAASQRW